MARLRTRAQIVLLAVEQRLAAPPIAAIVREDEETVRRAVTHGELCEDMAALVAAATDFFARHNREPQKTLSIIGSNAAKAL